MYLKELHLNSFRCFERTRITFDSPLSLICGHNGSGKTSLLEAIYYLGYLHSFRTHNVRELIRIGGDSFFIKAAVEEARVAGTMQHEIDVGFSDKKRIVRVDKKSISSYKELMPFYRTISMTEDDIFLIKGEPEARRIFLDQTSMLTVPESVHELRTYRTVAHNRTKLLSTGGYDASLHTLWTEKLWHHTLAIQNARCRLIADLVARIATLGATFFGDDFSLELAYAPKVNMGDSFAAFAQDNQPLFAQEKRYGRSLFGAHLDDLHIYFNRKKSRIFASRGQQKCAVILLKLAQLLLVKERQGSSILLLDDFMTDFDMEHARLLLAMLVEQGIQLIFTAPTPDSPLVTLLNHYQAQRINISN